MNFIFNNKLAIFLIFLIFYCLFNYTISGFQEGMEVKINDETGAAEQKDEGDIKAEKDLQNSIREDAIKKQAQIRDKALETQKELSKPGGAMDQAEEKQKIQKAAEAELKHDREAALSAKTQTEQKKATESSALGRMVESIDGETGQEMEKAALKNLSESVDKTRKTEDENKSAESPDADSGERAKALGTGGIAEEAKAAAEQLSTIAMKETMQKVAQLQTEAVDSINKSNSHSKNLDKKLSGVAKSYGLASQGKGFRGVRGNQRSGFVGKCQRWNPKELIKQRDRVAARFGCKERCKYLYDDKTGFLCDSGSCICKINSNNKKLLKLPGSFYKKPKKKKRARPKKKEGFRPKYVYRIHGKCDPRGEVVERGEA